MEREREGREGREILYVRVCNSHMHSQMWYCLYVHVYMVSMPTQYCLYVYMVSMPTQGAKFLQLLVQFDEYELYHGINFKKMMKAPSQFCFALRVSQCL